MQDKNKNIEIHLTSKNVQNIAKIVMIQQAEVATLDKICWKQYFIDKGYGWLLEHAKDIYGTDIDTPNMDLMSLGYDGTIAGWLTDILSCMHKFE